MSLSALFVAAQLWATPVWGMTLHLSPMPLLSLETSPRVTEVDPSLIDAEAEAGNRTAMDWTRGTQLTATLFIAGAGVLGAIQFADEYGFQSRQADTACATGGAVFGDCAAATPWPHAVVVGTSAVLGLGSLIASTQVDYDRAARLDGDWRIYEVTRWVGLGMFVAQGLLGFFTANAIHFGWADAEADFNTLQSLATAHLALGIAYAGLETFNTILVF